MNHLAPPVLVEDILVDGKSFLQTADRSKSPTSVEVPPGKHQFDFHYTALSYLAPDKVRFRYRILGQDEEWVDSGTKRFAHSGPLRPGQYGFQVIACNNDGVWNQQGAILNFRVLPQVWQTWWFQTIVGVMALGAGFSVMRIVATRNLQRKLEQLKQQHAIERDRERIARDIHDDLGAGLTQIVLQSAIAQREPPEHVRTHLSQISDTARDLVRTMDEIVWAVNPENDTLDGLVTYVGKFAQEYVTAAGIRCRLDLPVQLPSVMLSAETRHNLFLAIKEALNNAVKHARATEIFFQLGVEPAAFAFVVRDNGCGLEKNQLTKGDRIAGGNGLRNIQNRLKQIGGFSSITSEPGQGTEVRLTVMIQQRSEGRSDM
jgi:signal transduction histidine kinase